MIRYGIFVVLLLFVNISNLEGTECDIFKSAFKSYYQCILSCYQDVFGISKIKGDICTTDLELSGVSKDKFPISSIEDSLDCITARCRTAFPPSVCESSTNQGGSDNIKKIGADDEDSLSESSNTEDLSTSGGENDEYEYEDYDCYEVDADEQGDDEQGDDEQGDDEQGDSEQGDGEQGDDEQGDGEQGGGDSVSDTGSSAVGSSEEYDSSSYYYSSEYYEDEDEDSSPKAPEETDQTQITNVNDGGENIQEESDENASSATDDDSTSNNGNSGSWPWTSFFNFRRNKPSPALPSGSGKDNKETSIQSGSQESTNNEPLQPTSNNQAPATTDTRNGPGRWWSWFSNRAPAAPVDPANSGSVNGFGNSDDATGNAEPIVNSYDSTGNTGQIVNSYDETGNSGPIVNSYDATGNTGQNEDFYGSSGNDGSNGYNYFGNNLGNSYDAIGNAESVSSGGNTAVDGGNFAISNSFASAGGLAAPAPIASGNGGNDYYGSNPEVASAGVGNDYSGYNPLPLAAGPNLGNNYGSNAGAGPSNTGALNNMLSMLSNNGAGNSGLQGLGPITLNFGDDRIVIDGKQVQWHRNNQLMNTFILN